MKNKSEEVVITAALRTPIGSYMGSLKNLSADKLGTIAIKEVLHQSKLDANDVDEVIMGQVLTSSTGQNPARQSSINAGIPVSKPAHLINQVCGSGLRSIISGYQSIKLGDSKIIIAGGQENMSKAPHAIFYRDDKKLTEEKMIDTLIKDGLTDSFHHYHMGITAENIAEKYKISRLEQDTFALKSQEKVQNAITQNRFDEEIVKLQITNENKKSILSKDEHPRNNLELEELTKLKSVFKVNGTVTAGNASGINDGAAAVCLMTEREAKSRSINSLVKIVSWANCGVEPSLMGLGPIQAISLALEKANWKIEDIDLFEINEAFASQIIAVIKDLNIPHKKVNVNGGAIALGHPIGASGTRILVTLIHEMIKQDKKRGCASLCVAGGMGIAICVERN